MSRTLDGPTVPCEPSDVEGSFAGNVHFTLISDRNCCAADSANLTHGVQAMEGTQRNQLPPGENYEKTNTRK